MNHTSPTMDDTKTSARRALGDLQDSATTGAQELADKASARAARVREQASSWIDRGADRAKETAASLRDGAYEVSDRTQRYVREEPVKSVMVAAAAGAVLAGLMILLSRSRRW